MIPSTGPTHVVYNSHRTIITRCDLMLFYVAQHSLSYTNNDAHYYEAFTTIHDMRTHSDLILHCNFVYTVPLLFMPHMDDARVMHSGTFSV